MSVFGNSHHLCMYLYFHLLTIYFHRAQEELVRVNQAYQDVLEKNECRECYDILCGYRGVRHTQHPPTW